MIPSPVKNFLTENGYGSVTSTHQVSGGCISNGAILTAQSGASFFIKNHQNMPADMFIREAEGLAALRVDGGPRVPEVHLVGRDFILLEDLAPAHRTEDYWTVFGRQLAAVHEHINPQYGFEHDNYIGSSRQLNPWQDDGHTFFAEYRLSFQAKLAQKRGLLGSAEMRELEHIIQRLVDRIPDQPASLIHGDLWSGNAITDSAGEPAIIDPATHYGWAEADLAMTTLFGTFPKRFYQAYEEIRPLQPGYQARFPIYNLYHLLNHLNIFGRGYLGQIQSILRRFS
jgi:protein-ribulosamine 3-kinase